MILTGVVDVEDPSEPESPGNDSSDEWVSSEMSAVFGDCVSSEVSATFEDCTSSEMFVVFGDCASSETLAASGTSLRDSRLLPQALRIKRDDASERTPIFFAYKRDDASEGAPIFFAYKRDDASGAPILLTYLSFVKLFFVGALLLIFIVHIPILNLTFYLFDANITFIAFGDVSVLSD